MFCPNCGNKMNDGAVFCGNCGWSKNGKPKINKWKSIGIGKIIIAIIVFIVIVFLIRFIVPNVKTTFATAKIVTDENGREYYVDKDGNRLFNTWIIYKGDDYHLDDLGYIDKEKWIDDFYVGDDGKKIKNDWIEWEGKWYYLKKDGVYAYNEMLDIGGDTFVFSDQGDARFNTFFVNLKDNSKWSYVDSDCKVLKNDWFQDPDTLAYYYFDKQGYMLADCIELIDGNYYAFEDNGQLIIYRFFNDKSDNTKVMFADENGCVVKKEGFIDYLNATYFVDKNGHVIFGQWVTYDGNKYFLFDSGILARSVWIFRTYYVDQDGKMLYSTTTPDGYQVDADGKIIGKLHSEKSTKYYAKFISSDVSEFPLVKLYYKIYDNNGNVKKDFNIYEVKINERDTTGNYVPRVVKTGEIINKKQGLNISLIADRSTSLNATDLQKIKNAMKTFVSSLDFSVGDKAEVISFGSNITNICSFTDNKQSLNNGIDSISLDGSTALYDAIYRGISHAVAQNGARCVVVFTDGQDNHSSNTRQSVINYALQQQVPVYVVGVGSSIAESDLRSIATSTGGSYWGINNVGELSRVYTRVYDEGKSTYYIEYQTDNSMGQYALRNVQVTIDDGLEYVEVVNDFVPPNPNTIVEDIGNTSNDSSSSSSSGSLGSSSSSISSNSSSGFTMDYGVAINEKYDYDEDNEVTIRIRRPRINGADIFVLNEINGSIGNAMDDILTWCEEYIDNASSCPKTININNSTLKVANSSEIEIEISGVITFKGSNNTVNVSFMFTHDIGTGDYTLVEQ